MPDDDIPKAAHCWEALRTITTYLDLYDALPPGVVEHAKAIQDAITVASNRAHGSWGIASDRQREVLARFGYKTAVSKRVARALIAATAKNGWAPLSPDEVEAVKAEVYWVNDRTTERELAA